MMADEHLHVGALGGFAQPYTFGQRVCDRLLDQCRNAGPYALQRLLHVQLIGCREYDAVGFVLGEQFVERAIDGYVGLARYIGRLGSRIDDGRQFARAAFLDFLDMAKSDQPCARNCNPDSLHNRSSLSLASS